MKHRSLVVPVMLGFAWGYMWRDIKSAVPAEWVAWVLFGIAFFVLSIAYDAFYNTKAG